MLFSSISNDIVIQFRCKNWINSRERKQKKDTTAVSKKERIVAAAFQKRITIDFVAKN